MNEKRSKGLCFWCDEKYEIGHNCRGRKPRLYHIEIEGRDEELEEEQENTEGMIEETMSAQISLQALDGHSTFHTMRMKGLVRKKCIHTLLDTGSTHNFLDTPTALKLSCKVENVPPMWVKVADVGQLKCDKIVKNFEWKMQGYQFKADFLLLPLSGSDMVLGVQWFSTLGPILWDFKNLMMEFKAEGQKVKLRGATVRKLKGIQSVQLSKLLSKDVVDKRGVKRNNKAVVQWLVQWSHSAPEDATWEDAISIEQLYRTFDPWGQGSSQEEGIVMSISTRTRARQVVGEKEEAYAMHVLEEGE
uniref:Chromo domain-containing protein n=1 Tax=Chenopodium quinoa TaxID=63459 RepID=A0A803N6W0_CHEQI